MVWEIGTEIGPNVSPMYRSRSDWRRNWTVNLLIPTRATLEMATIVRLKIGSRWDLKRFGADPAGFSPDGEESRRDGDRWIGSRLHLRLN